MFMSDSQFEDQTIECTDCTAPFTFSSGEQAYYQEKGLLAPKRCASCRLARRKQKDSGEEHNYTCGDCSAPVTLTFKTERTVWCRSCFPKHKK